MEIFLIAVLTAGGSFFSLVSATLLYLSQDRLTEISESGHSAASWLHKIKLHSDRYIEASLIVEFIIYTVAAVIITSNHFYYNNSNNVYIYEILIYFIILIILRSILSTIGRRFADRLILKTTPFLRIIVFFSSPIVALHKIIDKVLLGAIPEDVSRNDLNAMVETAHEDGSIDQDEYRILKNIMHFSDVLVSDVMTPRTVVFSCKADSTVAEIINLPELQMYSRFPIWEGESIDDKVIGYVMSKDVLHAALVGQSNMKISTFAREVDFIPENAELDAALERFLQARKHLFLVVDEYGGVEGLLTMEDVLETMLGVEIVDEADKVVDLRKLAMDHRDKRIASVVFDKIEA